MSCTTCNLVPGENGWMAECGPLQQGPYLSRGIAFRVAASQAIALRRNGQDVRISVRDEAGGVSMEFCLCALFQDGVAARHCDKRQSAS